MKALAAILGIVFVIGCTKHDVRELTPWLKVDIRRPATGTSGVIVVGSREEVFQTKVRGRWVSLGTGHASTYMILAEGRAALVDLHDRKGLQLVSEDAEPRRVAGDVTVPPGSEVIDVFTCRVPAERSGCREAAIERSDVTGKVVDSFTITLPQAYPDCALGKVQGYDSQMIPYLFAQCSFASTQPKCILAAERKGSPFLYVVEADQPWLECSEFRHAGVSLSTPLQYTVLQ